jgi:hypothetical protein
MKKYVLKYDVCTIFNIFHSSENDEVNEIGNI